MCNRPARPRHRWRTTFAAGLALLLAPAASRAAEIYRIEDIPIDASAESAVAARQIAIDQGEREGLRRLMRRLTSPDHARRLPSVDTVPIDTYVNSFEIAEEKVAPTRYVGELNVSYVATAVQDLLRNAGLPFVERRSDPILVVPVEETADSAVAWDDANPWRQAWLAGLDQATVTVLALPLADLTDISTAPPAALVKGDREALAALAQRYASERMVVALARLERAPETNALTKVAMTVRDFRDWNPPLLHLEIAPETGEDEAQTLARAVGLVVAAIEDDWKHDTLTRTAGRSTLVAAVPLADLARWVQIRRDLMDLREVRSLQVDSLSRTVARVAIGYDGELAELTAALGSVGLALAEESDGWHLRPAAEAPVLPAPVSPITP